jgi:hypothetical protein
MRLLNQHFLQVEGAKGFLTPRDKEENTTLACILDEKQEHKLLLAPSDQGVCSLASPYYPRKSSIETKNDAR